MSWLVWLVYLLVALVVIGPLVACVAVVFVVIGRRKRVSEQRRSNLSSEANTSLSEASDRGNTQGAPRLAITTSARRDHDTPACASQCSLFSPSFDVTVADQTSDTPSPTKAPRPLPPYGTNGLSSALAEVPSGTLLVSRTPSGFAAPDAAPGADLAEALEGRRRLQHQTVPEVPYARRESLPTAPEDCGEGHEEERAMPPSSSAQAAPGIRIDPLAEALVSAPKDLGSDLSESSRTYRI